MSSPLSISDNQLDAILHACEPLQPMERSAFLAALAHRLRGEEIGDGLLFRVIREVLREIWTPPQIARHATAVHHAAKGEPIE